MTRTHRVEYVFAEPSGIVVPFELRNAIAMAARDTKVTVGPVVLLLNAADAETPFSEHVAHITRQQVQQADLIALTKVDSAADGSVERLREAARVLAPETPIHSVSLSSDRAPAALVDAILGRSDA